MALDTAEKRASSLHFARPYGIIPPTGTTSGVRRGTGLGMYFIVPFTRTPLSIDFINDIQTEATLTMTRSAATLSGTRAACIFAVSTSEIEE